MEEEGAGPLERGMVIAAPLSETAVSAVGVRP